MKNDLACHFSFEDLYRASYNKDLSKSLKTKFQTLDQTEINKLVLKWSKKAKWKTEERRGSDGEIYIAFHP